MEKVNLDKELVIDICILLEKHIKFFKRVGKDKSAIETNIVLKKIKEG